MTRKRFIKLAMSVGYQRNEAQYIADCAIKIYGSYELAYYRPAVVLNFGVKNFQKEIKKLFSVWKTGICKAMFLGGD